MMKSSHIRGTIVDRILMSVFPTLSIRKSSWLYIWDQQEFRYFTAGARAIFLTWAVVYGVHYWAIDIPAGKDHLELWAFQRAITTGVNLLGFLLTFSDWHSKTKYYRFPLLLVTGITIHMQALAMSWRADVPFFYVPLQAMLGVMLLRYSPIVSFLLLPVLLLAAKLAFFVRPGQNHHMVSASIVAGMVLVLFRSRMAVDLRAFIAEQENIESQRQLIEAQKALVDQLRSFLPREIYRRVQSAMKEQGLSASEASDSILRPRQTFAAILFTDIRGFTRMTNDHSSDSVGAITHAQQRGTEIVERFRGIPRLHGDLIYSYFDLSSPAFSLASALRAAFELIEETERLNSTLSANDQIVRYVIVTFGQVIVGNVGSTEGARDITVLGSAANLPSRIDPLTKESAFKLRLSTTQVILSRDAFNVAILAYPELEFNEISLSDLNLKVRDFPDEKAIFLLPTSNENWATLNNEPNEMAINTFLQQDQISHQDFNRQAA